MMPKANNVKRSRFIFVKKRMKMQTRDPKLRRTHKLIIALNDYEAEALETYCRKYKVENKVKIVREAIMTQIHEDFGRNYPTLFDKEELDRLQQR